MKSQRSPFFYISSVIRHLCCCCSIDADNDSDDEPGLFDSDDEDDAPPAKKAAAASTSKPMTKKERMEALMAKKRQEREDARPKEVRRKKKKAVDGVPQDGDKKAGGYESGDSYDSAQYVRTEEDNAFIDVDGDDEDALAELYADQHFDDERGEAEEEKPSKKKGGSGGGSSRYGRSERAELMAEGDEDNPLMQALQKMQRNKRVAKKFTELEEECKPFLDKMKEAADEDEEAIANKRPALKKLTMIGGVCEVLAKKDMQRPLLENGLLSVCKRWIQPLPNGSLGNITVRRRMLQSLSQMNGEQGITAHDLKASEFGKTVMSLYMHKSETPEMKKILKGMIEAWSRPIFQRSDNMRDLERVHSQRGAKGIAQISRTAQLEEQAMANSKRAPVLKGHRGGKDQDLNSLIKSGSKGKQESGINRVRVPFSKGFQYSVRPENRTTVAVDKRRAVGAGNAQDARGKLGKRMVEKGRAKAKNQRSANISIEGRQTKG